ncbi:hypothetical protein BDR07DRAFT_1375914 [Suillus spraguei]|nr:hypothetical protein BDR07DRAFT_1375914 [Suillus spraguei]
MIEQQPQQFQPDNVYPMSAMENMISKGVEVALKYILGNKDILTFRKIEKAAELSHERDFLLGEIWRLLKDTFSISQDADFIVHQPVDHEDVYSYEYKDGPAPNTQNLAFDLKHGPKTPWNAKILDILLGKLEKRSVEEEWSFRRSDDYYKAILEDCYKQLWTIWRAAQPKGILETAAEGRG